MTTMTCDGYQATVEFDEDTGSFHGEVIGLRDVITFQGRSVAELRKAFKESIEDYLAFCKARGEAPQKPFSGQFVGEPTPPPTASPLISPSNPALASMHWSILFWRPQLARR